MAKKQPNRRCSCGCGRPGKYLGRLEINGEAYYLGTFATKQERPTPANGSDVNCAKRSCRPRGRRRRA
jgi:hypothetical protein